MKSTIMLCLLTTTALAWPAIAQDCSYSERAPTQVDGKMQYRFTDTCGQPYEVGYRFEGKTLLFPRGGKHTLPNGTEAHAEEVLRKTYGLRGERTNLIRTKW